MMEIEGFRVNAKLQNPFRQIAAKSLIAYGRTTGRVVSSSEVLAGEAVFRGTRVSVQHVATLLRKGVAEREIREDFPALRDGDLAYANVVARFITGRNISPGHLRLKKREAM
jgi:uncharacterized protein (DUF433 family)